MTKRDRRNHRCGSVLRVLLVLLSLCGSQAMAAAVLSVDMTGPGQYIPGTRVDGAWTLIVTNTGDAASTPTITTDFPAAAAVAWSCTAGPGSSCANATGNGNLARSADVVGATNGSLTYTFDASLAGSLSVATLTVTGSADPGGTAVTESADSALSPLRFTFTGPAGTTYVPGTDDNTWILEVENTGATDLADVSVSTSFPPGASISWTCTADAGSNCDGGSNSGTGEVSSNDEIDAGDSVTYTLQVDFGPAMTVSPMVAVASAYTGTPAAVPYIASSRTIDRRVDVTINKTDNGNANYTPGSTSTWRVALANAGPSDVAGVLVTDTPPAGMTVTGWSCTVTGGATCSGGTGGLANHAIALPAGSGAVFIVTGSHPASATGAQLTNAASYSLPAGVTNKAGNATSDTASKLRRASTDLSVAGPADGSYTPGTTANTFAFTLTNNGPSNSTDTGDGAEPAALAVALPHVDTDPGAGVDLQPVVGVDWACDQAARCPDGASGTAADDFSVPVELAAGQSVVVTLTVAYPSNLTASPIVFTATANTTDEDGTSANNVGDVSFAVDPRADLQVTKTASQALVNPGTAFTYDLVLSNHGPSDSGVLLTDTLAATLERSPECNAIGAPDAAGNRPCWEYCPEPGKSPDQCETSATPPVPVETVVGSGDLVDLPFAARAGDSFQVRVYAAVGDAASGIVENTAGVEHPTGVGQPGGTDTTPDSASVDVEVKISTDIMVAKTDGTTSAVPGSPHSYTVVVRNQGFVAVDGVLVDDPFPLYLASGDAGFVPGSISWQCRAFDGACCNTNSAVCGTLSPTAPITSDGLQDHGVDLPAQSRVEFTVTGTLHPGASGTLVNEATATLPDGVEDSNGSNNTARDEDTSLDGVAGLAVDKRLFSQVDDELAGTSRLVYVIAVSNAGPSRAEAVAVSDDLDESKLDAANASWACAITAGPATTACDSTDTRTGNIVASVDLDVGGEATFTLTVDTLASATGLIENTATATHGTTTVSDTVSSGLTGMAELSITKTDGLTDATPGEEVEYTITVHNAGPDDVFGARVVDDFVRELEDVAWSCSATTPIPGDLLFAADVASDLVDAGNALALTADGRHAYQVATAADALIVYDRNNVPGLGFGAMLERETEVNGLNDGSDGGPAVSGMDAPLDVAVTAGGSRVYVLSPGAIALFDRDANPASPNYGRVSFAGALTSDVPADAREMALTADHLFVAGSAGVAVFALDVTSGLPSPAGVRTEEGSWNPLQLAATPDGSQLFVASLNAPYLRRYAIGDEGALALADSLAEAAYAGATELLVGPEGHHVYLSSQSTRALSVVGLDAETGAMVHDTAYDLTLFDALASPPPSDPFDSVHSFAIAPDGEHLLLSSNDDGLLVQLRRDPQNGRLSAEAVVARVITGTQPPTARDELAVTPDGRHVLVASASDQGEPLQVFVRRAPDPLFALVEVDRNGDASASGTIGGLLSPSDVAVSHDGDHVYAVSMQDDSLTVFRRFPTQGMTEDTAGNHLQFVARYQHGVAGVQGLDGAHRVRVAPDGSRVYVTSEIGNSIAVFTRDAGTGALSFLQALQAGGAGGPALVGATGIAIDATHTRVYVAARFENAIAVFKVVGAGLSQLGVARGGVAGVTGMGGIIDLAISGDQRQLLGVSHGDNSVVVFDRSQATGDAFGTLSFVHARLAGAQQPIAIALPRDAADPHVYIVAENSDELVVMRRITDPSSPEFGRVVPLFEYANNAGGITGMDAPRDLAISPDGRRLYVAARDSSSILIFDRDLNQGSASHGGVALVEVRSDGVDGVEGIDTIYALAVSNDSRHVYAAGFDDASLASFAIGNGSSCSAGGSGGLDDLVNIGRSGTLEYRVRARIRPDATVQVCNTATVEAPPRVLGDLQGNNTAEDCTNLKPEGDLSLSKTNDQVSVVAGQPVDYEVVVRNPGPSHLVHTPGTPVTLTDALPASGGFVPETATWTCAASGSGALDFVAAVADGDPGAAALAGASGLVLLPDSDVGGPLGAYLAAASVLDNAVTLFRRDPLDGRLQAEATLAQGSGATHLAGARALAASADGRFLYVASRTSDAITVLELGTAGSIASLTQAQVVEGFAGLDQPVHLLLAGADQQHLYVAGANDGAIAVFARNATDGTLGYLESEANGVDDLSDGGGVVAGLANVQYLAASPDGLHVYALSGTGASIARFDRDPVSGRLSWRGVLLGSALPGGASLAGASAAVFDAAGDYLYVAATDADAVLVFERAPATGVLTLASQVQQGVGGSLGLLGPRRLQLSGDGGHLYVSAQGGGSVAWYLRDPADGSLRYLGQRSGESAGVTGLAGATGLVLDEALGQLYVAGTLANAVVQFERNSDSFCPPSGTGPLLAVPFDIAAGGTVTFSIQVEVDSTLDGPLVNTASVDAGTADPNPANNEATDTDVYTALADLTISKDDGLAEYDGLAGASALAADADHLFVAGAGDNGIGVFARVADPAAPGGERLQFASAVRGGEEGAQGLAAVADLLLSPDGAHVYVASPVDNSVAAYGRGSDGALSFLGIAQNGVLGVTGLSGARALAQSPDGRHVYVAGSFSNAIAVFARDAEPASPGYGTLAFRQMLQNGVGGVQGLGGPLALAVSPDGKHLYALGAETDTLATFLRNTNPGSAGFGNLSYASHLTDGGAISGLAGVRSLLVHPDGSRVYVLGDELGSLAYFARDAGTGQLAFSDDLRDGEGGVSGLAGAARLRASADGASLYVAAAADAALLHFVLGADGVPAFAGRIGSGDPAPVTGGNVLGLGGASDLFVDALGQHAFAVGGTDAALAAFGRAADGSLAFHEALFDGLGGVAPGDTVRYVIRVDNLGPSDVPNARVVDAFPAAFDSVGWRCFGSSGAQCAPGEQAGNIDTIVNLPVGGWVVFEADGVVGESATGRLSNTATVAAVPVAGVAAVDPDEASNSATDDDTVLSPAVNLVVSVDDGSDSAVPGDELAYDVVVANLGPSYAEGVVLSDQAPAALRGMAWTCAGTPVPGVLLTPPAFSDDLPLSGGYRALRISGLGQHAYAVGSSGATGAVAFFRRDPLSGSLSVGATYEDGVDANGLAGASDMVLSSDERFAWVAGTDADAIVLFERDAATGSLAQVALYQDGDFGIDGLGGVAALALSPDGETLYAAGRQDDAILAFAVDAASGALSPLGLVGQAQGLDGLNGVDALAFSADGAYLFAIAGENQALGAYARAANGSLTQVAVTQNFELATDALVDPSALLVAGTRILVADAGSDRIAQFSFDPEQGFALDWTLADGAGLTGLVAPRALAFDPQQARLYVAATDTVHLLSLLGETPEPLASYASTDVPALAGVSALALAPNGRLLYSVADAPAGAIAAFARERGSRCESSGQRGLDGQVVDIAPGGTVAFRVTGLLFANAAGSLEYAVTASPRSVGEELDPADNGDVDVDQLTPAPDLAALKSDGLTQVVAGTALTWRIDLANAGLSDALGAVLSDPAPLFPAASAGLLVGSGSWTCAANQPLAAGAVTGGATLAGISGLALARDGSRLYAVNASTDALLAFPRATNGTLGTATVVTLPALDGASSVAVAPDGSQLFVTAAAANSLVVFSVAADGALAETQVLTSGVAPIAGLLGAAHVVVAGDGRHVFVAAPTSHAIAVFSRDPATGVLAFVERVADGFGTVLPDSNVMRGVRKLQLSADGAHLYALAEQSQAVTSFAVNPQSGRLTYLGRVRHDDAGGASLAGARDLAGSGDSIYALGSTAVTLLVPGEGGALGVAAVYAAIPELGEPRALALDASGSRLYLADAAGAVHVFARDWSDGTLTLRQRHADPLLPVAATSLLSTIGADLYLAQPTPGRIERLNEQALSRCLLPAGSADQPSVAMDLGVGGWAAVEYTATVHPSARGALSNTASFLPGSGADPALADNAAIDGTDIRVVSDLSISKTGPALAVAGERVEYRITVSNAGPSSALGMRVLDLLPAPLQDGDWTCTASTGSSCEAAGSGSADVSADLLPGGSLEVVLTATVAPGFRGALANAASVVMEVGATDPTPDDHGADVSTDVSGEVDLGVSKDNGGDGVVAGAATTYTITVANAGPSDALAVGVADLLPDTLAAANWSCSATGAGSSCPPTGSGDVQATVAVGAGGSVAFSLVATVDAAAEGLLENTASASILDAAVETAPGDEQDTDSDLIALQTSLSLLLSTPVNPFDPASAAALPFSVTVANAGPSLARAAALTLTFSAPVVPTLPVGCSLQAPSVVACTIASIDPGSSVTLDFALRGLPAAPGTFSLLASVVARDTDPSAGNDADSRDILLQTGGDVQVAISNGEEQLVPGREVSYTIDVANIGSATVTGIAVDVVPHAALLAASWTCTGASGATCTGSGSGAIADSLTLASGQSVRYRLSAVVDPSLDPNVPTLVAQAASASAPAGSDINTANNSAVDEDVVFYILFADGFEEPLLATKAASDRLQARECAWLQVTPGQCPANEGAGTQ